ncbi:MAG TPA: LytR C-terminal domain-containing protein [Patescibacteria group bacterium]
MLNTQKLLYILPDVAYVTELLPGKKEHTFVIHSFRQINGEFLDDNDLLAENIQKLIGKLEADEYHLVLPDFLFTNTIVEVAETSENKIKEHLKEKLLPNLSLSKDTHDISTTILTEYGGKTKIQLSAIEKSVLNPIAEHAPAHNVKISGISPLSWTVKSIISLEPSISIIQMGSHAYLALHYIGVDQTISDSIENIETLGETIKTLKGAEPSIQTVYLLTNELVEEKLKEQLSDTLPLQQLTKPVDEESQMPSYVKQIIESGMRTLSIDDFPVPQFPLGKPVAVSQSKAETDEEEEQPVKAKTLTTEVVEEETDSGETAEALPAPSTPSLPTPETPMIAAESETAAAKTLDIMNDDEESNIVVPDFGDVKDVKEEAEPEKPVESVVAVKTSEVVVSQKPVATPPPVAPTSPVSPLPKKNPANSMVKMLLVSATVFLATVGVGVGLGLAVITLTQKDAGQVATTASPSPVTSPTPVASPSPSPSPEPEIVKEEVKILIVNATTKAGYAGETGDKLEAAGFTDVTARNAKGEYEEGFYVLLEEENAALIDELTEATGLDLTFSEEKETEDTGNQYDVVIVLAE